MTDSIEPMKESELMTFGAHKGKKLGDVPAGWLIWFWQQTDAKIARPELFAYIERNIRHLQRDAKQERFNRYDDD